MQENSKEFRRWKKLKSKLMSGKNLILHHNKLWLSIF